uniref:Uncharacterized protein n=1 Tax=Mycena chlorophos TaxID=658473 RepID=A0ABQ0KZF9_MYCCL|nr:predicted protein [Mycena chlorophos]
MPSVSIVTGKSIKKCVPFTPPVANSKTAAICEAADNWSNLWATGCCPSVALAHTPPSLASALTITCGRICAFNAVHNRLADPLRLPRFFVELQPAADFASVPESRRYQVQAAGMMADDVLLSVASKMSPSVETQITTWLAKGERTANKLGLVAHAGDHWLCFTSPGLDALFSGQFPYRQGGRLESEMRTFFERDFQTIVTHGNPGDDWKQMLAYKRRAVYEEYPELI